MSLQFQRDKFKRSFDGMIKDVEAVAVKMTRQYANDTGDMYRATTSKLSKWDSSGTKLEGSVFVDPSMLYNKRKKYKSSKRDYPIYPHGRLKIFKRAKRIVEKRMNIAPRVKVIPTPGANK